MRTEMFNDVKSNIGVVNDFSYSADIVVIDEVIRDKSFSGCEDRSCLTYSGVIISKTSSTETGIFRIASNNSDVSPLYDE